MVLFLALVAGACAPAGPPESTAPGTSDSAFALPVEWLADSARSTTLPIEPPPVVWVARVTPVSTAAPAPSLPDALPSVPEAPPPPPRLEIDPGLRPPILRRPARIEAGAWPEDPAWVELDVQVDAEGRVSDAVWAGGTRDTALVRVALECAHTMAFFPAMRAGAPVAVWCRQRFDFPGRLPE
jgi:TonB family protein